MKFGRNELGRGVAPKDLLAVAGRSAEFDAANRLLNEGSNLQDVILTPAVLSWLESGPEPESGINNSA